MQAPSVVLGQGHFLARDGVREDQLAPLVHRWQAYDEAQLALELAPWLLYVRQGE